MAYYFGINLELGAPGLWYGYAVGLVIILLIYTLLICKCDWEEVSKEIQAELQKTLDELESSSDSEIEEDKVQQ